MTKKKKPQIIAYHFIILLAALFLFLNCKQSVDENASNPLSTEIDSISTWIVVGRDASKSFATRKSSLQKAYESALDQSSDTIKLKYLSRIQWSFLGLEDSLWFRKTNENTNFLARKLKDSTRLAGSYWDLGLFLNRIAVKDSAFYHLSKAQKIYGMLGDNKRSGTLHYDIAIIQAGIKDYTGSEISLIQAIKSLKPIEDNLLLHDCYNSLGSVSKDLGDYKNAAKYFNLATKYLEIAGGDKSRKQALENNIAVNYHSLGEFEKAISYFKKLLRVDGLRLKSPSDYARLLTNLAHSEYMLNANKEVESMFLESIKIRDSIKDIEGLAGSYFILAKYYTHKKDTLKAISSAKKSQAFAKESSNYSRLIESTALLTSIDRQNASVHGQKYIQLSDSLRQEERNIRNKFERISFETNEILAENEILAREKQLWTGIAAAVVLLGFSGFIIYTQRTKNRNLKFKQAQQASNQEIFNLLLAQNQNIEEGKQIEQKRISEELHDGVLGKMLGARMMLIGLNKKVDEKAISERAKAISILQGVEGEVRSISHELSHAAYQKINNFILSIQDLCNTIQSSYEIEINFMYAETLDWDALSGDIKINLYRMVQEILQNSVKHSECTVIQLNFIADVEFLKINIADNGKGFVIKKGRKGIGMRNIASRIEKINGTWDLVSEIGHGTTIKLVIPLVLNENENGTEKDLVEEVFQKIQN